MNCAGVHHIGIVFENVLKGELNLGGCQAVNLESLERIGHFYFELKSLGTPGTNCNCLPNARRARRLHLKIKWPDIGYWGEEFLFAAIKNPRYEFIYRTVP